MVQPPDIFPIKIDHDKCTECRMCYVVCREISFNAVIIDTAETHLHEIDIDRCVYPRCAVCLMYFLADGSIVEAETGKFLILLPAEAWTEDKRWPRRA